MADTKITFEIKLDAKDLYGFNMYQTYTGVSGWMSILLGGLLIVLGVLSVMNLTSLTEANRGYAVLYIVIGAGLIIYVPVSLWIRVNRTLKQSKSLGETLNYEISEGGISVSQGQESANLPWNQVYKMTGNAKRVLVYSSRINAYVIPSDQLGMENYRKLKELAGRQLPSYRNKMKEA